MNDLIEFLRARLEDDEETALAASPAPWSANAEHDQVLAADGVAVADGFALSGQQLRATVDHITRFDPARALAEVEASDVINAAGEPLYRDSAVELWEDTVKLLALPYASHANYRQEWTP